ncbi:MAG: acyl carrier protein [Chlorobi bacterium]|nr:acyl carrier protein [Chlorobiota bacterium]
MESTIIRKRLYRVFRKTGVPKELIDENARLNEDLFIDENDMTCFLYYLETNFNVNIDNKELPRLVSVKDTIDYLQSHCA